ncbi:hotdog fold thioesterase [Blastococcus sp. PRF04-17]|uniref:hotdog fold thioesterase n=1 Tax=Blastococcus sp. PRF04-17 TaxID=2933797 RepID=UPI0021112E89|nr:hotdog fold thioesterase [Blastococcus sp. PRF04-17]
MRAARAGSVTAVCTPVRTGRTLSTWLIQITDDQGRPTASARLTTMTLSPTQ